MKKNHNVDIGRSISDALQEALQSGNFSGLRQTVDSTFHTVVDKTIECAKSTCDDAAFLFGWDSKPKTPPPGWGPGAWDPGHVADPDPETAGPPEPAPAPKQAAPARPRRETPRREPPRRTPSGPDASRRNPPARHQTAQRSVSAAAAPPYLKRTTRDIVFGILIAAAGLLLLVPAGISALYFILDMIMNSVSIFPIIMLVIMLVIAVPGAVLTQKGTAKYGRARRFKAYWGLLRNKGYCEISALAGVVEKKQRFVLRDVTRMLNAGLFPEGRLDEQKTCLILGDELYRQYRSSCDSKKQRQQNVSSENAIIAAGLEAVRQIRSANEALPGAVITEKLSRLEDVTASIFAYVEQRPSKLPEIRKFMDYYLPTTVKLVKSYQDFEEQPETASTHSAKEEILATLDTINTAFESLLDGLYQDDAMDVSTDISVLKTMLAQEGLTDQDFKKRRTDHE